MKALSNLILIASILTATVGSMGFVLSQASTTQTAVYQLVK